MWGKSDDPSQPFYSGSGSHDNRITQLYVSHVTSFFKNLPNKPDIVDLGCGDFAIGSKIRQYCNHYIACDIVPALITHNKVKYKNLNVNFEVLDLNNDTLPSGDIVIIRQVLQHLTNAQIQRLIPKISLSYKILILTEHLPKSNTFLPNIDKPEGMDIRFDIKAGYNSGVVLTKHPFNLRVLEEQIICEVEENGGVIRTTLYRLK
jgi:hypothetical protein